ncbi:MAG: glycosyltransferase family 2 protein [Clostridiales bacterium]
MNKIDVSFIILSYNKFDILRQSLYSIIANTKKISYEIIVFDNNSTDGEISNELTELNNLVIYKNDENIGWSAGINKAISITKGDYVCIVDNDVLLIDNVALRLLEFCKSHKNIIVAPRILNKDMSIQNTIANFPSYTNRLSVAIFLNKIFPKSKLFNPDYLNFTISENQAITVDTVMGACLFFSKEVIQKVKGFDESLYFYAADYDICMRMYKNGGKVYYNSNAHAIHLGGIATGTNIHFSASQKGLDDIKFFRKHYSKYERKLIYLFTLISCFNRFMFFYLIGIICSDHEMKKKASFLLIYMRFFLKGVVSGDKK